MTSHAVLVKFKEAIEASSMTALGEVEALHYQDETKTWKLETANPESVRRQLLKLALKDNLNIVSLQSESKSLEDVFRSLTIELDPADGQAGHKQVDQPI
jgi:ABC-2 type transport system ATP-binding protein